MEKELVAWFSGHVQGCGFRYYTLRLMAGYPVSGYVKNLPDGRVELLLQGEEETLAEALRSLQEHHRGHIRSTETTRREPTESFDGFQVRY